MALEIVQIPAGEMANFSYLVFSSESGRGLGVDPSFAPQLMLDEAKRRGVTLDYLVNTHGHHDHNAGNGEILAACGARLAGHPLDLPEAEIALEEGSSLDLGGEQVVVLHTPGHTPGSITLNPPGALITGDTLFVTRVGRADLQGSDVEALYRSIGRLAEFPGETTVYPGHDYGPQPISTIAYERAHNPFMQCPDLKSFVRLRLG